MGAGDWHHRRDARRRTGRRHDDHAIVWIWWSRLQEATHARELDCLDEREQARLRRFRDAAAADRFVLGTALAKAAVSWLTGLAPHVVPLDRTCDRCGGLHGPPRLSPRGPTLSITHAGDLVGVALRAAHPVGLDVEPLGAVAGQAAEERWRAISSVLHPAEHRELMALDGRRRAVAALSAWTRKEAVLKAAHLGLTTQPKRLCVSTIGPPRVIEWPARPEYVARGVLAELRPDSAHVATVACLMPPTRGGASTPAQIRQLDGADALRACRRPPRGRRRRDVAYSTVLPDPKR